jgi:hypothetical protein
MPVAESGYYTLVRPGPVQVWRCERCQALIEVRPPDDAPWTRWWRAVVAAHPDCPARRG